MDRRPSIAPSHPLTLEGNESANPTEIIPHSKLKREGAHFTYDRHHKWFPSFN